MAVSAPAWRRVRPVGLSVAAGAAIELLPWALPLARVVSPLDAALIAAGAVAAGALVTHRGPAVRTVRSGLAR
jgi:hypothetical protein